MREFNLGCKTMHDGIIVAAMFLLFALVMLLAGRYLVPQIAFVPQLLQALGTLLILFVPVILITTWLRHISHRPMGRLSSGH